MRIEFTSLNLYHLIQYSLKTEIPFYINNIYLSEEKFINILTNKMNFLISTEKNNSFIYTSERSLKKIDHGFNNVLSALLKRKKIINIEQIYFDRIIKFQTNSNIRFFIEFIPGKFNFIITDNSNKVINLYSYIKNKQNKIKLNLGDIYKYPADKGTLIHYLDKINKEYIENNNIDPNELLKQRIFHLYYKKNTFSLIPYLYSEDNIFKSQNISELIEYAIKYNKEKKIEYIKFDKIKKIEKRILQIKRQIENLKNIKTIEDEIEILKEKGETLKLHITSIQNKEYIDVESVYSKKILHIELNKHISPSRNLENIFKRILYLKNQIKGITINQKKTNEKLIQLENEIKEIENSSNVLIEKKKKKKNIKKIGREFISPNGFRVLCGRNAKENDIISTKIASNKDLFFHAREQKGSHVVLFTNNKIFSKEDIEYAASIAAYFSAGKHSKLVAVQYTEAKYVVKRKKSKFGQVQMLREKVIFVEPKQN